MTVSTVKDLMELRGKRQVLVTTCHDAHVARMCEVAGMDVLVTYCKSRTTDEQMATIAEVRKGAPNMLIAFGPPPVGVWHSRDTILDCALRAEQAGANIIWCAGMSPEMIKPVADAGLPCGAHVGFVSRHKTWFGGPRAVGKTHQEAIDVYQQALAFQEAGAIALEVECVPHKVASEITKRLDIHTFSLGSGTGCTGTYIFSIDLLGMHDEHYPRHAKKYCNLFEQGVKAFGQFALDVNERQYPGKGNVIEIQDSEFDKFLQDADRAGPRWVNYPQKWHKKNR